MTADCPLYQPLSANFRGPPRSPVGFLVALRHDPRLHFGWPPAAPTEPVKTSKRRTSSALIYAYVISGAIESKVNNGETRIYRAGESWTEPPNASHPISRNASKTEPAKLLAVFVLDTNDNPPTQITFP